MRTATSAAFMAFVLAAGASGARADALATATLSDFRIQLVDLDPNDGIAPSVTFVGTSGVDVFASPGGPAGGSWVDSVSTYAPISAAASSASWNASAGFSGDPFSAVGATVSTQAGTALVGYNTAAGASILLDDVGQAAAFTFTLSPETQMLISGLGHVSDTVSSLDIETASSSIILVLDKLDSRGAEIPGWYSDSLIVGDAGAGAVRYDPVCGCLAPPVASVEHDAPLSLSMTNSTDADLTAQFGVGVSAFANSNPVSVPEPGGVWLGLAGLVVVAGTARYLRPARERSMFVAMPTA